MRIEPLLSWLAPHLPHVQLGHSKQGFDQILHATNARGAWGQSKTVGPYLEAVESALKYVERFSRALEVFRKSAEG